MTIVKYLLGFIAAAALAMYVTGQFLDSEVQIKESVVIEAPVERIDDQVQDLKAWQKWMPFFQTKDDEKPLDVTYSERSKGVGARMDWMSGEDACSIVVTKSDPKSGITYEMKYGENPPAVISKTYSAEAKGKTRVSWAMEGNLKHPVAGGWLAFLAKSQIETQYAEGLKNLKTLAETGATNTEAKPQPDAK